MAMDAFLYAFYTNSGSLGCLSDLALRPSIGILNFLRRLTNEHFATAVRYSTP